LREAPRARGPERSTRARDDFDLLRLLFHFDLDLEVRLERDVVGLRVERRLELRAALTFCSF